MRVSVKLRIVCTRSAPCDGDLRIGCFITSRASRDPFEPEMSVIAFVSQYGFPSRNGGPIRIQVGVGAGLRRFATPPYFFLVALLVLLSPSDGPSKARLVVAPRAVPYWLHKTLGTDAFSGYWVVPADQSCLASSRRASSSSIRETCPIRHL
jgi:hypothetical protein